MKHFSKVLVANRGEIALRIFRTCKKMGLQTVAVYSDADANAPFVRFADEAVRIGTAESKDSYLRVDRILEAAARTGAEAIHPGYGFLSENAEFAEACANAGIVFVGPSPKAIRAMGLKREAKELAAKVGVPTVPGWHGSDQSSDNLAKQAKAVGYPVLLKASAGGGGKGMRIVRSDEELTAAIEGAKREAQNAFGNDTLLVEKYVDRPRHIEVQILGDNHGNLVHLFERECTIQRRHQKVIEEAPSAAVSPETRTKLGEAAVALARAIGYSSAGTVEFVMDGSAAFYFLEVNTRLQVEHPVTECITGLDLVREQLRVARGETLGYAQSDLSIKGAAVECRLYAEDADNGFLPQTGTLVDFHVPSDLDLRLDSGFETGSEVSIYYDPMLAKMITYAPTRTEALDKMCRALNEVSAQGVITNRAFLTRVLQHESFRNGEFDTHFIETHMEKLKRPEASDTNLERAAYFAAVARYEQDTSDANVAGIVPGYRNNRFADALYAFKHGETLIEAKYRPGRRDKEWSVPTPTVNPLRWQGAHPEYTLDFAGHRVKGRVVLTATAAYVHLQGEDFVLRDVPRFPELADAIVEGGCIAPMPGKIVSVPNPEGTVVKKGDTLVVLEAMKMEHTVRAAHDATVARILVKPGDQVESGALLAILE